MWWKKVQKGWEVCTMFYSEHRYTIEMILAFFKAGLGLVILAFFAANFALTLQTQKDITNLQDTENLAFNSISIVHEMAKERGVANFYLTTNGTAFKQRFIDQQAETDGEVQASWGTLNEFTTKGNDAVQAQTTHILSLLEDLDSKRAQVQALNISSSAVVSYYTTLINYLIDVPGLLDRPDAGQVSAAIQAYIAFAHIKDKLGLQRATTIIPVWRGQYLSVSERDTIHGHTVTQDAFETIFNISASREKNLFANLKTQPVWTNFTSLADQVLQEPVNANFSLTFTYDDWWDIATPAIDAARDIVESSLRNTISSSTDDALANLETQIIINSFGMALTIVIVLGYIFIILFNASFALAKYLKQRKEVKDMANKMTEGGDHNWD